MDKSGLLKIKEFSELTKVNPKSLRYYDSLGILNPVYADPENGYRYYSVYQREMAYAIELCLEAGIPLKRLREIGYTTDHQIRYRELMAECTAILEDKIRRYQTFIEAQRHMQGEIERAEMLAHNPTPITYVTEGFWCLTMPFEGNQHTPQWKESVKELICQANQRELGVVFRTGLLLKRENGSWRQYLFAALEDNERNTVSHPDLLHIPDGIYLRRKADRSGMDQVWDWTAPYAKPEDIELVVETELFLGVYRIDPPLLEQRCLLKQRNT